MFCREGCSCRCSGGTAQQVRRFVVPGVGESPAGPFDVLDCAVIVFHCRVAPVEGVLRFPSVTGLLCARAGCFPVMRLVRPGPAGGLSRLLRRLVNRRPPRAGAVLLPARQPAVSGDVVGGETRCRASFGPGLGRVHGPQKQSPVGPDRVEGTSTPAIDLLGEPLLDFMSMSLPSLTRWNASTETTVRGNDICNALRNPAAGRS